MNRETERSYISSDSKLTPARLNPEAMANLKVLEELGVEGAFHELIKTFLEEIPDKIELLGELAANRKLKKLARGAHDLKNACATLGADTLSEMSYLIEKRAKSGNLDELSELICSAVKEYSRVEAALLQELRK